MMTTKIYATRNMNSINKNAIIDTEMDCVEKDLNQI
jgi:hypothetical protein